MDILDKLVAFVNEKIEGTEYFIVETKKNKENTRFQILVDGDKGLGIDACASISRHVSQRVDEEDLGNGRFTFEISSPGADRPLLLLRQYPKNIGRTLQVVMADGKEYTGRLTGVTDQAITIEQPSKVKGKKAQAETVELNFHQIKQAKVKISFK